jgi:hypothetical protein
MDSVRWQRIKTISAGFQLFQGEFFKEGMSSGECVTKEKTSAHDSRALRGNRIGTDSRYASD